MHITTVGTIRITKDGVEISGWAYTIAEDEPRWVLIAPDAPPVLIRNNVIDITPPRRPAVTSP